MRKGRENGARSLIEMRTFDGTEIKDGCFRNFQKCTTIPVSVTQYVGRLRLICFRARFVDYHK